MNKAIVAFMILERAHLFLYSFSLMPPLLLFSIVSALDSVTQRAQSLLSSAKLNVLKQCFPLQWTGKADSKRAT